MRSVVSLLVVAAPSIVAAAPGGTASGIPVEGVVVDASSHWTADGSRIVTEATVRTTAGDVVVSQLGGSVGGLGMRTFPGPPIMTVGMRIATVAERRVDLAQRTYLAVDDLRVLDDPQGFVRTGPTQAGHFLFWESGCVLVTPDAAGTSEVLGDNEFQAIHASIAEWNTNVKSCSYMDIVEEAPVASEVGRDGKNLIKFRDQSWCRPAIGNDPARCYAPSAAGLTTAVFVDDPSSSRDGAIVDADIELNGANFAIADNGQSEGTAGCQSEIKNTLTHELGHLLGLEHPCLTAGDPPRVDGTGKSVPACSQTSDPVITEATMYNFQDCGETKKETLSPDDIGAICSIYPLADDPGVCGPPGDSGGCCSASGGSALPPVLLFGLTALLLAWPRKQARAS